MRDPSRIRFPGFDFLAAGTRPDEERARAHNLGRSMTRPVILKLATGGHGRQCVCAVQDLLEQGIILQSVRRDVVQVLARRDDFVAQPLHLFEHLADQLIRISIRIG